LKFDLKSILKSLKLNESTISMFLGAVVIAVVAVLLVNYFKDETKGKLPVSTNNSTELTQTEPGETGTYTVLKGESLWVIAEKQTGSGYNWVKIAQANKISNPGHIEVGQKLSIPVIELKNEANISETSRENLNSISGATYEVQKGDNLWNISIRAYGDGYKWVQIARENKLVNPNLIHPGNVLALTR